MLDPKSPAGESEKRPSVLNIAIVGGSIAGLICGIVMKHAGHNVHIYDQGADQKVSHMAGVGLARDLQEFLSRHDRLNSSFVTRCKGFNLSSLSGKSLFFRLGTHDLTSWDALYYRLRANFDGYTSQYCPTAPVTVDSDGTAAYHSSTRVLDIQRQSGDERLVVAFEHSDAGRGAQISADFVIGADGPNSFVRTKYLPESQRRYTGTVVWRGIVPENELSQSTRDAFADNLNVLMPPRQNCVVYVIPGPNGSLKVGERFINCAWYTNETDDALSEIMCDKLDGKQHHNTVPAGHLKEQVWHDRLKLAKAHMPASFLELIQKIERPFVQKVTEHCASQPTFEDGRVLLVGDALAQYRPHLAMSGGQAAFDALQARDYINGTISRPVYIERVMRFAVLHWSQSEWWRHFYMSPFVLGFPSMARFWWYSGLDRLKAWWLGEERLRRV